MEKIISEYIKNYLNTKDKIEVQEMKELIDGSLNVTISSDNPEFDGKCYYINWVEVYELNKKYYNNENNI